MLAFVLLFIIAVATAANAPELTFKFTKNNVPGAKQTEAEGINNAGVTVGQYWDSNNVPHGYILKGKKLTKLDDPNGSNTIASDLPYNGAIKVVGWYTNSAGADVGFLYDDKTKQFTDIPGPPGTRALEAGWINDKGEIVGYYEDSSLHGHGFLLQGRKYKTLDVPGAVSTTADGINNKGDILLLWWNSSGVEHSYLYKDKKYIPIDVPGATNSQANGINNEDDIAYWWDDSSGRYHGALLHGGKYYKFDYPKAYGTYADGINDKHTISGGYEAKRGGPWSGFKATY